VVDGANHRAGQQGETGPPWQMMTLMMMMTMMMMMMMMMMISPFGQLGLWAPSSGVRDGFTSSMFSHTPVGEKSGHPH